MCSCVCVCVFVCVWMSVSVFAANSFFHSLVLPRLFRISRSFLTKRVLPCACSAEHELQLPPNAAVCPLPGCPAPAAQTLLGHAYGVEDACRVSPHRAPLHDFLPLAPTFARDEAFSVPILLSHLPLHRHSLSCGVYTDSKPIRPNFRLYSLRPWTVYSSAMPMQSSSRLLREVKPLLVLSGDHHSWCTTVHSTNAGHDTVEVTVGTFSWLQGSSDPSFGALLFTNSSESASLASLRPGCVASHASEWHAVVCPCWLPDNRVTLAAYASFAAGSMFWLLLELGSFRVAISTWFVTCAAAVCFHALLL